MSHTTNSGGESSFWGSFSKKCYLIFPIKRFELPQFLLIGLTSFCILSVQNIARATKDSVVNTLMAPEVTVFLKLYGVAPAAVLVSILYIKLLDLFSPKQIFYFIISSFIAFFLIFAFILFPHQDSLHLSESRIQTLIATYPHFRYLVFFFGKWSFSLFYIVIELWQVTVDALLFWQFVNSICTISQSKRFYPLLALISQTSTFVSGIFLVHLNSFNDAIAQFVGFDIISTHMRDTVSLQIQMSIVSIAATISLLGFWILNRYILSEDVVKKIQFKPKENKTSFMENIKMIASSRYIRLLTMTLLCYGIAINLVETPWKAYATKLYPNPTDYSIFAGSVLQYTGIAIMIFIVINSSLVRLCGWFVTAMVTPVILFSTGVMFFVFTNFDYMKTTAIVYFSLTNPIIPIVIIGAIQNILSKSSKYTNFDTTKEMLYVPLELDLKTKGKAAADMLGNKFGKAFSSFIISMILFIFPNSTYISIAPILMVFFCIICVVWVFVVIELNKEYKTACDNAETTGS